MRENEELRRIRQAKSMSLQEAAKIIGTTADQLSKLERAERQLNTNWLKRILPAYGMTLSDFYAGKGISEHETGGLQSPKAVSFQGAPPMPLPDPYTAARAGAMAYAICHDIQRAEKIGAKAAQSAMLSDGKITEHLIRHYIEMEGE